jgi:hypothetical protein
MIGDTAVAHPEDSVASDGSGEPPASRQGQRTLRLNARPPSFSLIFNFCDVWTGLLWFDSRVSLSRGATFGRSCSCRWNRSPKVAMSWLPHRVDVVEPIAGPGQGSPEASEVRTVALETLRRFRSEFFACLDARADALFELADAVACAGGPVRSLPELSLEPEHRRGHGGAACTTR